jgi:MOSC domain-containing protein YiiM
MTTTRRPGRLNMKLVSVNVGLPRQVEWRGRSVTTGIFKSPVAGRVPVRTLNLDGDRQADLSVHGGPEKAVYAYPTEHYEYWREELPGVDLPPGSFGENLTTEGLRETEVRIGDRFRIGSTVLRVTQPRMPCHKLGVKFERDDMVRRFLASERTGFYLAVVREGDVGAGDAIERLERAPHELMVSGAARLYAGDHNDPEALRRAAEVEDLPESWREHFRQQMEKRGA